jgi:hypothetical protein
MAVFRNVQVSFWQDVKVMEEMTPEDKYFYLYLLTNPNTTQIGIYPLTKKQMAFDTGYSLESIQSLLKRFESDYQVIKYNHKTREIVLLNWGKYNLNRGGKPIEDCVQKELMEVKDKMLIQSAIPNVKSERIQSLFIACVKCTPSDKYHEPSDDTLEDTTHNMVHDTSHDTSTIRPRHVDDTYHDTSTTRPRHVHDTYHDTSTIRPRHVHDTYHDTSTIRGQEEEEKEKEKEKEIKDKDQPTGRSSLSASFEQFWSIYPKKVGKQRAFSCWQQRIKETASDQLITAAENYAQHCKSKGIAPDYIKHPNTFLSAKKDYLDWLESPKLDNITPFPTRNTRENELEQQRIHQRDKEIAANQFWHAGFKLREHGHLFEPWFQSGASAEELEQLKSAFLKQDCG